MDGHTVSHYAFRKLLQQNITNTQVLTPGFPRGVQTINLCIGAISVIIIMATYAQLIRSAPRISNVSLLPMRAIAKNVGNILEKTWVDTGPHCKDNSQLILRCMAKLEGDFYHTPRSIQDIPTRGTRIDMPTHVKHWVTSGSLLTKYIVQAMVWEWIGFYLSLAVLISTLSYNGFFTGSLRPDATPRLVVVSIYIVGYLTHATFMWARFLEFITYVAGGSAWSMLNKANFGVLTYSNDANSEYAEIDKASTEFIPKTFDTSAEGSDAPMRRDNNSTKAIKEATKTINEIQTAERDSAKDSLKDVHEKIVSNSLLLGTICLSMGFTVWTSAPTSTITTQIGSWGLLASLSVAGGFMFTSAISMQVAVEAYKQIVLLKEVKINNASIEHVKKSPLKEGTKGFSFSGRQKIKLERVTLSDMFLASDKGRYVYSLIFGPVYGMMPSDAQSKRDPATLNYSLTTEIDDKLLHITTVCPREYKENIGQLYALTGLKTVRGYTKMSQFPMVDVSDDSLDRSIACTNSYSL